MRIRPPENTRTYYLALLDELIERRAVKTLHLGGVQVQPVREGDPVMRVDEHARLKIILKGTQRHGLSRAGERCDLTLTSGEAIFWAPHAWTLPRYDERCVFFGIVFRRNFMRTLLAPIAGEGRPPGSTPHWYHTSAPISGPAVHLVAALTELAERPADGETELAIFTALLRLAREHLARDADDPSQNSRALQTFQRVIDYLHQNYAEPITRDSVAAALDLHPNYLSALCTQIGERSFHDTLEALRLDHARHLLRQSDLKLERIAQLSGYASTNYFIKVFRRLTRSTPGKYRLALKR